MLPTIESGKDNVFQMPLGPKDVSSIKRGEAVSVLRTAKPLHPKTPKSCQFVIGCIMKRIAGLEGDVMEMKGSGEKYRVPVGHCWLLGDNPNESRDSRYFGAVPLQNLRAKLLFTYRFPFTFKWMTNYC